MLLWTLGCMHLLEWLFWFFSRYRPQRVDLLGHGSSGFSFFRNLYSSPLCFHQLTFPSVANKGSLFSLSSLTFVICTFFFPLMIAIVIGSHHEMISQCWLPLGLTAQAYGRVNCNSGWLNSEQSCLHPTREISVTNLVMSVSRCIFF